MSKYINIPLVLAFYVGFKLVKKSKMVLLADVPLLYYIEIAEHNPEPPAKAVTGWQRLNILWS